uniref:Nuclear protein MDM1 n=1 Tax=Parastrongyloides trichosuri TaxID=131310 RepID=A0A0N4ZIR9_PARTI
MNNINNKNEDISKSKVIGKGLDNKNNNERNNKDYVEIIQQNSQCEKQISQTDFNSQLKSTPNNKLYTIYETFPKLNKKHINRKGPMIKKYWEKNIEKENQERTKELETMKTLKKSSYEFPRWRSIDAMSASLVASSNQKALIPNDSTIPEFRKEMIDISERNAEIERNKIKLLMEKSKPLKKVKSMETLSTTNVSTPWYDREQINEAVSRESISDVCGTREKWITGAVYNKKLNIRSNYIPSKKNETFEKSKNSTSVSMQNVAIDNTQINDKLDHEYKNNIPQINLRDHKSDVTFVKNISNMTEHNYKTQINQSCNESFKHEKDLNIYPSTTDITLEQYYFLKFLYEKKNLCQEFNITIPVNVYQKMEEIANSDKYYLISKTDNHFINYNNFYNNEAQTTPTISEPSTYNDMPSKHSRFVKNQQNNISNNSNIRYRRASDNNSQTPSFQYNDSNFDKITSISNTIPNNGQINLSMSHTMPGNQKQNFYGKNYYNM